MSTEICVQPYKYQGQVYSPAFSEPSSPSSISSEDEEHQPLSPMSTSSDHDQDLPKLKKRKHENANEFRSKVPKYANKYEELLQPLSPVTTLPCDVIQPLPSRSHASDFNAQLQSQFESVITEGDSPKVEDFLSKHSTQVNVNQYNSEGRTALQQSCLEGNSALAKVLVKYGADHQLTTRDGFSTLHLAIFSGHSNLFMYILSLPRLRNR